MVRNPSQTGVISSPGTLMGGTSFGTPLAGLGLDLSAPMAGGTPGQMNLATPLGAAPMAMLPSLSQFGNMDISGGVGAGLGKRNEDEERRAKMHKVLRTIGRARSRVSEESIARISRRLGLQNDIDAEKLSAAERLRKVGNRTIGIAGKTILIDVELKEHIARNVSVMLSGEGKALEEQGAAAGLILLQDLAARDGILLRTPLDAFAANLSYLAHVDRLSEKVNCFEAMSGIYTSLRRLYDLDVEAAKTDVKVAASSKQSIDDRVATEVTRKRNGKPTMHEDRELGVAIEYWKDVLPGTRQSSDELPTRDEHLLDRKAETNLHVLRVDIESSSISLLPPVRISDAWLPEQFELPDLSTGGQIPWQDPPVTYISGAADSMDLDSGQRLPDLHFVAKLDPPIVVPLPVAANILTALGASQNAFPYATYQTMLLDIPVQEGLTPEILAQQAVFTYQGGKQVEINHRYALDVPRPDYGFKLHELPFSHPRQIIELLPVLRQWAFLGILLRSAFGQTNRSEPAAHEQPKTKSASESDVVDASRNLDTALDSSIAEPSTTRDVDIEIVLLTSPSPSLSITFVEGTKSNTRSIDLQLSLNGEIMITNLAGESSAATTDQDSTQGAEKLARALALCGDLGVWLEWLRKEVT